MSADLLAVDKLLEPCSPIKTNKSKFCDEINFNMVRHCFGILHESSKYVFEISSKSRVFPKNLKIARVPPYPNMMILKISQTIDHHMFFLVFPRL